MNQLQKQFPLLEPGVSQVLSEEPIFLDGMKVLFDVTVGLYPVKLTKKNKKGKPENVSVEQRYRRIRPY
jgi:hypothetical protein